MSQRSRVRCEESVRELERLQRESTAWFDARRRADKDGQYATQLRMVHDFLQGVLQRVRDDLPDADVTTDVGEVYTRCRDADTRLTLTRRLWEFYRVRWDQRDDTTLGPVLRAAEEVIFSCYRQPFEVLDVPLGPAPLPYFEPHLSPHAITRDEPPSDLRSADPLMREYVARLPVPLIGLPPACVDAPWLLIHLAHETGHHVQQDLLDRTLIRSTMEVVRAAARAGGADGDEWAGWSQEVFADAFALFSVGEAASWAIAELELGRDDEMLLGPAGYPAPVVRQALLRAVAEHAGLGAEQTVPAPTPTPAVDGLGEPGDDWEALRMAPRAHLKAVPKISEAIACKPLGKAGELRDLCRWEPRRFSRTGASSTWGKRLRATSRFVPPRQPDEARIAVAGAVAAWYEIAGVVDAKERNEAREHLRERLLELLPATRPPGRRSATAPAAVSATSLAASFADALFARTAAGRGVAHAG